MSVGQQVFIIYALTHGFLFNIPTSKVKQYEEDLFDFLEANYPNVLDDITTNGLLPEAELMDDILQQFNIWFTGDNSQD